MACPEYGNQFSGANVDFYLVFAISTGIENAVVRKPLIMLAQKWQKMPSFMKPA
jgi:hypothetical protein